MATATASFSFTLATDALHSYVALTAPASGRNTFAFYETSITATDQIEYGVVSSGLSVSTNGAISVDGAISNISIPYRRWRSVSKTWGTTATAVYYPANTLIDVGYGSLSFAGSQPSLRRDRNIAAGSGSAQIGGIQQFVAGQLSNYSATLSIILATDVSHSAVTLTSVSSGAGFLSASPGLAIGNQIEYETYLQSAGGSTGRRVYLRTNGSYYTETISALQVITFRWRYWSSGSWSNTATATVDLGGQQDIFIPSGGALNVSGMQPSLRYGGYATSFLNASLSIYGNQPDIGIGKTLAVGAGELTLAGSSLSPINPPAGAGILSIVGLQPTIIYASAPPINPGEGIAPNDLLIVGQRVSLVIYSRFDIGVAGITFEGLQPNIVTMGRWESTAAQSLSWGN